MSNVAAGRQSIVITANVDTASVDAFLKGAADNGNKIYGRKTTNGDIELYAKPETSTRLLLRDKIGAAMSSLRGRELSSTNYRVKQELGRQGLETIFAGLQQRSEGRGLTEYGALANRTLFSQVRDAILRPENGALIGKAIFHRRNAIETLAAKIPLATDAIAASVRADPTPRLATLSTPALNAAMVRAAADLRAGHDTETVMQDLATAIHDGIARNAANRSEKFAAAMADQTPLLEDIGTEVKRQIDAAGPHTVSDASIGALVGRAGGRAVEQLTGVEVGATTKTFDLNGGGKATVSSITVGGKTYEPQHKLAEGGFGAVVAYQASDGAKLAVKVPIVSHFKSAEVAAAEKRDEARDEVGAHLLTEGTGHANVVHLHGVFKTPDGQFGIVLDHFSSGSLDHLAADLHGKPADPSTPGTPSRVAAPGMPAASGQVTPAEARLISLVLLTDVAGGMEHMHSTSKVTNFDIKSPNMLLDSNGRAAVADFGTAKAGANVNFADAPASTVQALTFKAPEFIKADNDFTTCKKDMEKHLRAFNTPGNRNELKDVFTSALQEQVAVGNQLSTKVDSWSLGVSLMQLATGALPPSIGFDSDNAQFLVDFSQRNTPALAADVADPTQREANSLYVPTGNAGFDDLANRLLAPQAADRLDMAGVLAHPALTAPEVNLPEVRGLIVAIKSGDDGQIDAARAALGQAIAALNAPPPAVAPVAATPVAQQPLGATNMAQRPMSAPPAMQGDSGLLSAQDLLLGLPIVG